MDVRISTPSARSASCSTAARSASLARQDARRDLHEGHRRAEASERLRELDADRARAQHDEPGGQRAQLAEHGLVRVVGDEIEPGHRGHDRARAGGDAVVARAQRPAIDAQLARRDELAVARDHVAPGRADDLGALLAVVDLLLDRGDAVHDAAEVDRLARLDRREAVLLGARALRGDVRAGEQRLARHAVEPRAVAAEAGLFDDRDARAQQRPVEADDEAGGAAADHDEVVALVVL